MTGGEHRSILDRLRQPGSAKLLAVVRVVIGVHLLTVFTSPAFPLLARIGGHPHPMTATWFGGGLEQAVAANIEWLVQLGAGLSIAMALGLGTRVLVPLLCVLFVITQNYWFRSTLFHDDWLYFGFPLLALGFARTSDAWSLDALILARWRASRGADAPVVDRRQYRWPVEALVLWFAFTYVAAGVAKLFPLSKGLLWLTGISAQQFAVEFVRDSPWFWILGHAPFDLTTRWPFAIAAFGTVLVELGAGLLLFTHRYRLPLFLAILALHASIWMFGIPAFPQMALALGVALIPPRLFSDGAPAASADRAEAAET